MAQSASRPAGGRPPYDLSEVRDGLLEMAARACDGQLLIHVAGSQGGGVQVNRVRRTRQFGPAAGVAPFLDAAYQTQIAAVLALITEALDDLAPGQARWQERDSWTAKITVRVAGGWPLAQVEVDDPVPHRNILPGAARATTEPERVARLRRRGYAIAEPERVASLLQQHPALEAALRALPAALRLPRFFPDASLALIAENGALLVLVHTALEGAEALARLNALDAAWATLALPSGREHLVIDVETRTEAA